MHGIFFAGVRDPILQKLAKCANGANDAHICRNLHKLLANPEFTIQVQINWVKAQIKHPRKLTILQTSWPIIKLGSWVRYILEEQGGQLLLGGHHISQTSLWQKELKEFWDLYEGVDGSHPLFQGAFNRACTIPYFVHGDEGRGRGKQPVLIISFQGILSHFGKHCLNESGFLAQI